jgi:hypothetical protein
MDATKHLSAVLNTMTDDFAAATSAVWSKNVNRAFKTIERVRFAGHYDLKTFVVVISTTFTNGHTFPPT